MIAVVATGVRQVIYEQTTRFMAAHFAGRLRQPACLPTLACLLRGDPVPQQ